MSTCVTLSDAYRAAADRLKTGNNAACETISVVDAATAIAKAPTPNTRLDGAR